MFGNKVGIGVAVLGLLALAVGSGSASAQEPKHGGLYLYGISRPSGIVMVEELFGYEVEDAEAVQKEAYWEAVNDWKYGARIWAEVMKNDKYPVPKPVKPRLKKLENLTGKSEKERGEARKKRMAKLESWNVCVISDIRGYAEARPVRKDRMLRAKTVAMTVYANAAIAWTETQAGATDDDAKAPQVPAVKVIKKDLESMAKAKEVVDKANAEIAKTRQEKGIPAPDRNPSSIVKAEQTQWPGLATIYHGANWGGDETYVTAIKEADYIASGCADWQINQCSKRGLDAYVFLWGHEAPTSPPKHRYDEKVLCYYLGDRVPPSRWGTWAGLEAQAYAGDPHHPTVFSMSPRAWGGINVYFPTVRGRAISYYHYHWDGNRAPHYHFVFLEQYRQHSALNGYAPIVRLVESRPEDMRKTSQTIFTSLAYGVRGFVYGGGLFDTNKRDARGVPTQNVYGKAAAKINKAIKAFSPVFTRAKNVDVFQTLPLPLWAKKAPEDYWVRPTGSDVVLGIFADRYEHYLVIANRDAFKAHEATLHFAEEGLKVAKMNKDSRKWEDLALKKEKGGRFAVTIPMEEAGGELLRVIGHYASPTMSGPDEFIRKAKVRMTCRNLGGTIHYTLDGSEPTKKSAVYKKPVEIDKTSTVRAIFVHSSGRASSSAEATFTKVEPRKADGKMLGPGVAYEYYEGSWTKLPAFDELKPVVKGVSKGISLEPRRRDSNYALRFTGHIEIETPGSYTFTLGSDDGSRLIIDGKTVLDIDGVHGVITQNKAVELKPGMHKVRVLFFQGGGGAGLQLRYAGPEIKQGPPSFWCEQ